MEPENILRQHDVEPVHVDRAGDNLYEYGKEEADGRGKNPVGGI